MSNIGMDISFERPQSINGILEQRPELSTIEALAIQREQTASYVARICKIIGETPEGLHQLGGEQIQRRVFEAHGEAA